MPLPCNRLEAGKWQTYNCRPEPCKSYRCGLLRRHDAGGVSHDDSIAIIEQTKARRARLVELLKKYFPDLAGEPLPVVIQQLDSQIADMDDREERQFRAEYGELMVERASLELYLLRYFRVSEDVKNSTDKETMGFIMPRCA